MNHVGVLSPVDSPSPLARHGKSPLRRLHKFSLHIPTAAAHIAGAALAAIWESDQMTNDQEMKDIVRTSTQERDVVELGEVSVETKGGAGTQLFDGGAGWWF
jgi:hypothetical protein